MACPNKITTISLSHSINPLPTAGLLSVVDLRCLTSHRIKTDMCSCKTPGLFVTITLLVLLAGTTTLHAHPTIPEAGSSLQSSAKAPEAAPQKDNNIRLLEPGKPIERELAGGESHAYQL